MTTTTSTQTSSLTSISAADRDFLVGPKGFIERYLKNCAYFPTRKEAYEHTELQYTQLLGRNRYSSYESFRTNYAKFCAKRKKSDK